MGDRLVYELFDGWAFTFDGVTTKALGPAGLSVDSGVFATPSDTFTPLGDKFVFGGHTGEHGAQVWITDGTSTGTQLLKDLFPGSEDVGPGNFHAFGDAVLFSGADAAHGEELWITDGTTAGTHLVKDINKGQADGISLAEFADLDDGRAAFVAQSGAGGSQIWITNGTEEGTFVLSGLPDGANPGVLSSLGDGRVAFSATGDGGRELGHRQHWGRDAAARRQ